MVFTSARVLGSQSEPMHASACMAIRSHSIHLQLQNTSNANVVSVTGCSI